MTYIGFYHPHAYGWILMIILFFASYSLYKKGAFKPAKITQMVLRLFFVIIFVSGFALLYFHNFPLISIAKAILAFYLAYLMEKILARAKSGSEELLTFYWSFLFPTLIIILLIGYNVITF